MTLSLHSRCFSDLTRALWGGRAAPCGGGRRRGKWFVNGRAICRYGIRRGERGSDRRISGATGRSRVARSGLMPHGDAVGEWVMNLSRKIIVAGLLASVAACAPKPPPPPPPDRKSTRLNSSH